jgi:Zn-dependent peptidase ImmA (M78 family)
MVMLRADIEPSLLTWARERAGLPLEALISRFPRLGDWERGTAQPTFKQLESFASATFVPIGFLLLPSPPREQIPIPDYRTIAGTVPVHPSPHLLDTIYDCQARQAWYRDFAIANREPRLPFVGSLSLATPVVEAAAAMRSVLRFDVAVRAECPTWGEALRLFIAHADAAGVLVMVNGVVQANTHRPLDPHEFRGFCLVDDLAPVVFINGADTKAAQTFTLAHELAHVWLGSTALSDAVPADVPKNATERWCNQVAAELLVPIKAIAGELRPGEDTHEEAQRLARHFKVSTLVVLRRIHDAGALTRDEFCAAYEDELTRLLALPRGSGGNFHLSQAARVSKRFARAIVASTLEGYTLYRDAFRMLGMWKQSTFDEFARTLSLG